MNKFMASFPYAKYNVDHTNEYQQLNIQQNHLTALLQGAKYQDKPRGLPKDQKKRKKHSIRQKSDDRMTMLRRSIRNQVSQERISHQQIGMWPIKNLRESTPSERNPSSQFFDLECFRSQSITRSMLVEFLHEIIQQHTSLSVNDFRSLKNTALLSHSQFIGNLVYNLAREPLTFGRSILVWTQLLACQFCFQAPGEESHEAKVYSKGHGAHFSKWTNYHDQLHQQHTCKKDKEIRHIRGYSKSSILYKLNTIFT